jgi:hypothetical protein
MLHALLGLSMTAFLNRYGNTLLGCICFDKFIGVFELHIRTAAISEKHFL